MNKVQRFRKMYLVMAVFWGLVALVCLLPSMPGFEAFANIMEVAAHGIQG